MSKNLIHILLLKTMLLFVIACGSDQPQVTPQSRPTAISVLSPTPSTSIEIVGGTTPKYEKFSDDIVVQNNCGGSAEAEYSEERSKVVAHTLELGSELTVTANGAVKIAGTGVELGTAVAGSLGYSYGNEETITRSQILRAAPQTNMQHTIRLLEVWQVGTAKVTIADTDYDVPFDFRTDFAIQLVDSTNLGCPTTPPTITQEPPTVTVAPTETEPPLVDPTSTHTTTPEPTETQASTPTPTSSDISTLEPTETLAPTATATSDAAIWPSCVAIGLEYESNNRDDIFMVVERIEFSNRGEMTWTVGFWNRSTEEWRLGVREDSMSVSNLSSGTIYPLLKSDTYSDALPSFQKIQMEFVFEAPSELVETFTLRHFFSTGATGFTYFDVALVDVDTSSVCQSETMASASTSNAAIWPSCVAIGLEYESNNRDDIFMVVEKIDFSDRGEMTWTAGFWNRSTEEWSLGVREDSMSVSNLSSGTIYPLLKSDTYSDALPSFQKIQMEFVFEAPSELVETFTFRHFFSTGATGFTYFDVALVDVDISSVCQSETVATTSASDTAVWPSCIVVDLEYESNNRDDIFMVVEKIEFSNRGEMTWTVSFWNRSTEEWSLGVREDSMSVSSLSSGTIYPLLKSDTHIDPLPSRQKIPMEFVFEAPSQLVETFTLRHFFSTGATGFTYFDVALVDVDTSSVCE